MMPAPWCFRPATPRGPAPSRSMTARFRSAALTPTSSEPAPARSHSRPERERRSTSITPFSSPAALRSQTRFQFENSASTLSTGINGAGALESISGTNTWSGAITMVTGGASIGVDAGTLNLTSGTAISGSGLPLTLVAGSGAVGNVNSVIGTGAGTLTKLGAGQWNLKPRNTFTGNVTVNAGTLSLSGAAGACPPRGRPALLPSRAGLSVRRCRDPSGESARNGSSPNHIERRRPHYQGQPGRGDV